MNNIVNEVRAERTEDGDMNTTLHISNSEQINQHVAENAVRQNSISKAVLFELRIMLFATIAAGYLQAAFLHDNLGTRPIWMIYINIVGIVCSGWTVWRSHKTSHVHKQPAGLVLIILSVVVSAFWIAMFFDSYRSFH